MTQAERRVFLIRALLAERGQDGELPADAQGQRDLLRALMNVREPAPIGADFLAVQDAYLKERLRERGVVRAEELLPIRPGSACAAVRGVNDGPADRQSRTVTEPAGEICLWRGDITRLAADAIVNAANSGMTGCYAPLHLCIDNCIHTYAGVQLRLACAALMEAQGHPEPTGTAKITEAYNLPSRYVLHTVGPVVGGTLSRKHERQLASCYDACLGLATARGLKTLAFCCISTGVFGFPKQRAAEIAVQTVTAYLAEHPGMRVIFNVFGAEDEAIYRRLLEEESK